MTVLVCLGRRQDAKRGAVRELAHKQGEHRRAV